MIENNVIGSIFSKRMSELFDLRVENDKEILEGLNELSVYLHQNTPKSRRNLKSLIEERTVEINYDFLNSFQDMRMTFQNVTKGVHEMNSSLQKMKSSLASTKHKTKTLIEKTLTIQKEIRNVSLQSEIISSVIDKFQLNSSEVSALRSTEVTSEIFSVLEKTEGIIKNGQLLLQAENHNLAQDIIEQMVVYQDTGMERLFRWVRGKCSSETVPLNSLLPLGMAKLQKRTNLFEQILDEMSANRSIVLVRQFIDALTLGGRPIELRVTEPRRYVGDMLAWLHQSLPSEIEFLNFIFKNCDNSDELVQQTLSKITEGVCHPLRVRVEHILLGEDNSQDCVLLQDIYVLIKDYHNIVSQLIRNSRLNSTFIELVEVAEKTLLLSLQNKVSALISLARDNVFGNLYPAESTEKILSLLVQLLSADVGTQKESHVLQMVSCVIDPLMNQITETASKLPTLEMAIYLLNNFHFIETSLALFPFLDDRLERLKAQCDAQIDTLTSEQASALVGHLNLGPIYTILQGNPTKPLCNLPAMESSKLSVISRKLEKFLTSPNLYHLPQLALLSSASHRLAVQKRSFTVITSIYASLHAAVHDPENGYKNPNEIFPISPDSVNNTLLNVKERCANLYIQYRKIFSSDSEKEIVVIVDPFNPQRIFAKRVVAVLKRNYRCTKISLILSRMSDIQNEKCLRKAAEEKENDPLVE